MHIKEIPHQAQNFQILCIRFSLLVASGGRVLYFAR
jgi:hypothetical protein